MVNVCITSAALLSREYGITADMNVNVTTGIRRMWLVREDGCYVLSASENNGSGILYWFAASEEFPYATVLDSIATRWDEETLEWNCSDGIYVSSTGDVLGALGLTED